MRQQPLIHTPVVLILFNRPEATRRVFEKIALARPRQLLIIADGPRHDRTGEDALCAQARQVIDAVDWDCELQTNISDHNLGCKQRLASGLDWVFSIVESAIILEDDCLPDPTFFLFCEQMLDRYRDDERVYLVRGTNLLFGKRFTEDSYYFSTLYNIWGWATWKRAWRHYDVEMRAWPALRDAGWLEQQLPDDTKSRLVRHFLDETHAGRINTWDYQLLLAGWQRHAVAIVPERNLITNIGHGDGATHTLSEATGLATLPLQSIEFPLRHPPAVEVLKKADEHEWRMTYPTLFRSGFLDRLKAMLRGRA